VKRAIRVHRTDFIAILVLVGLAAAVVIYLLQHQPAFTLGKSYYTVKVEFATGAAVTAGQGQSVDVAGVQVGQIGAIHLQGGRAIVTMNIFKKYQPIYRDATVLLRPRTPLKDMYLSLDPGTKDAGAVPAGGMLPVANSQPDVNVEEILSTLDVDTRNYILLLLSGGAQLFHDGNATGAAPSPAAVADLTGTLKRFAPLNRDTKMFTALLKERTVNIRRSIHNFKEVSQALGSVDGTLTSLINSSNTNFAAISSQDQNLEDALTLLPGTLQQTTQTLGKVQSFAKASTPALRGLVPFAHAFGPALSAATPLFRDTTPVIKNQLRPFSVAIQPLAKILAPASAKLNVATPALTRSVKVLNSLFNTLAYQPAGSKQGYLFWGSWLAHNALSLTDIQDAQGPAVRGLFMGTCQQLQLFEAVLPSSNPALKPLLALLNAPDFNEIRASGSPFCNAVTIP
jgi:phospholipid/cholesterol/gamma-HCH transport system substrate-binding protein